MISNQIQPAGIIATNDGICRIQNHTAFCNKSGLGTLKLADVDPDKFSGFRIQLLHGQSTVFIFIVAAKLNPADNDIAIGGGYIQFIGDRAAINVPFRGRQTHLVQNNPAV